MVRRPTRPQRLWFVVAGDVRAAMEDPGTALGDGAVKGREFRVEVAERLRLRRGDLVTDEATDQPTACRLRNPTDR
jgi:hypothetical protein